MTHSFQCIDRVIDQYFESGMTPGLSFALVRNNEIIYSGGRGMMYADGPEPDTSSIFRIASMTKSFVAAAILKLRDEGKLNLDDSVITHIPQMKAIKLPTPDSPELTIRHLLTMSAGFPTDDPWGDRCEPMTPEEFNQLISRGFNFIYPPGIRFEYSNLSYVLLGRIITNCSGVQFQTYITENILNPLKMTSTRFTMQELNQDYLTRGHRKRNDEWLAEDFSPTGEFAALGGLFSSVKDLTIWVSGMVSAFDPHEEKFLHPISRTSRREMQQGARVIPPGTNTDPLKPDFDFRAYGFGLVHEYDRTWGSSVGHSGGYPGYGTHMRWHIDSGYGFILLSNSTYAPSYPVARNAHRAFLEEVGAGNFSMPTWPRTLDAFKAMRSLLREWDANLASSWFSLNVEMDESYARREKEIADLKAAAGLFVTDEPEILAGSTPAQMRWREKCQNGELEVFIQLTPENPSLVQTFSIKLVGVKTL